MKRRDFLGLTTLAAGAAALTPLTGMAQSTPTTPVEPGWIPLTKEVKSTRIGFGTGVAGWNRQNALTRAGYPKAVELLRHAYDKGIRLFDCADLYGSHDVVAEALKDKPRDSYVLVSKVWLHNRPGLPESERPSPEISVRRFLQECRTDYIDIMQIHCMTTGRWTQEFADGMESLAKLKTQGLIRAHGVSTHTAAAIDHAAETEWCDVIHVCINSEGTRMDAPPNNVAERISETIRTTKKARDAGKGTIAMKIFGLGQGELTKTPESRKQATKFVMDLGCLDVLVVGFTEKEHIDEFVANVDAILAQKQEAHQGAV